MSKEKPEVTKEEKALLKFLKRTKDGAYAPVEESSLLYNRAGDEASNIELIEEEYYYSVA